MGKEINPAGLLAQKRWERKTPEERKKIMAKVTEARLNKRKKGDPCKYCGTKLLIKLSKFKLNKLNKPWFYTAQYHCTRCRKGFLSDDFKITREQVFEQLKNSKLIMDLIDEVDRLQNKLDEQKYYT